MATVPRLDQLLCQDFGPIIGDYLQHHSRLVVVLLAPGGTIVRCNRGFLELLGLEEEPLGTALADFLTEESRQKAIRPSGEEWKRTRLAFLSREGGVQILVCHLFPLGGRLLLFGENIIATESELLQQVSDLNRQLANLVRQVRAKNRELERVNARVGELVNTDALTGIANRRALMERLERERSLCQRHGQELSLVMADLDRFKQVNDTFGHSAGDAVLKAFAQLLERSCRREDFVARFGGEEFVVLLPMTGVEGGARFAENLRLAWEETEVDGLERRFTASFGVAGYLPEESADNLFRRADAALYRAKRGGRNRVEMAVPKEEGERDL